MSHVTSKFVLDNTTGWRRPIGCLKLQVIFHKWSTNHRALLWKMTHSDHDSRVARRLRMCVMTSSTHESWSEWVEERPISNDWSINSCSEWVEQVIWSTTQCHWHTYQGDVSHMSCSPNWLLRMCGTLPSCVCHDFFLTHSDHDSITWRLAKKSRHTCEGDVSHMRCSSEHGYNVKETTNQILRTSL